MPKTEFKVDEVFLCGLIKLKCIEYEDENHSCRKCFFRYKCDFDIVGFCSSKNREDRTNVIFVKVEE